MRALRAVAACAALCTLVAISACSPAPVVHTILAYRCLRLGGPAQETTVAIPVHRAGLLHVAVRERGISAVASIGASGKAAGAASPIDRLGTITLVADAVPGSNVPVHIASIDSEDITADVCISAQLVSPPDSAQARAWRGMAAGDHATGSRQWQAAFDHYLAAARILDGLGMRETAAAARHAMAELEYSHLRRERDSVALAAIALGDGARDSRAIRGARLMLMAKALSESPKAAEVPAGTVEALLRRSSALFAGSTAGHRELPRVQILLGYLDDRTNRMRESRQLFDSAAATCRRLRDWECFAQSTQNIATLAQNRQSYAAALSEYEDALRSLDSSRVPKLYADISYNLGRLENTLGMFERSERSLRVAMELYARQGYCDRARRSAASLGEMLVHVGSIGDAAAYLSQTITLSCPRLLAALSRSTGTAPDAIPLVGGYASLRPFEQHGMQLYSTCAHYSPITDLTLDGSIAAFHALLASSEIARTEDRLKFAAACLADARFYALEARTQVRLANASGDLLLERHEPRAARARFIEALRISEASELGDASEFRGAAEIGLSQAALLSGRPLEARSHALEALRLGSRRADLGEVITSLRLLAEYYDAVDDDDDATMALRTAIRLSGQIPTTGLDAERRATYLATQHDVFAELTDILARRAIRDSGHGTESIWRAFDVADQGHARSFRYAFEQADRSRDTPSRNAKAGDFERLLRSIAALARSDQGKASGTLVKRVSALPMPLAETEGSPEPAALSRALTEGRSILIEYAVGREDMYAFVMDGARLHVAALGSLAQIEGAAEELSERLRAPEPVPDDIRVAAERLARLVLWPIERFLSRNRIVIVADDALHTIPFAVLPWSSTHQKDLMVDHAEISSIPAAAMLIRSADGKSHRPTALDFVLLGDPVLRSTTWHRSCTELAARSPPSGLAGETAFEWNRWLPSLPGSRTEVLQISDTIRRARPSASIETLLGCEATPSALRHAAGSADVLHIATHGIVDARRPRLSALVLTPGSESVDDAAFRLLDILGLSMHARLVVMSACDTSSGRLLPGEGVLGLAQAFLLAGARSVVASYWQVGDSAAQAFMQRFYRYLLVDRLPAASALRRAQLDESSAGDSYAWAAFSLYGRPDSSL